MFTLTTKQHGVLADAVAVNISNGVASVDGVMGTLGAPSGGQEVGNQTRGVVLTYDARGNGDGAVVNTLAGDHANRVTDYTPIVMRQRGYIAEITDTRDGVTRAVQYEEPFTEDVAYWWRDGNFACDCNRSRAFGTPTDRCDDGVTNRRFYVRLLVGQREVYRDKSFARVIGVDKQSAHPFADVAPTLKTDAAHQMGPVVAIRTANTNANGHGIAENITHTLDGANGQAVMVMRQREGKPGGGKGPLLSEGKRLTLGTTNDQVVFTKRQYGSYEDSPSVASTLGARDHTSLNVDIAVGGVGRPRRLMPVETERLMGWGDGHTALGIDEQGREYALKDTPRYKLCGNGVASPVAQWIARRLAQEITAS